MDASLRQRAEELATEFAGQARTAEDLSGLMRLMMKSALERMLNTEMDVHLGRRPLAVEGLLSTGDSNVLAAESGLVESGSLESGSLESGKRSPNRRNGHSRKTVRSGTGELTIATPRDRDGTFEPQLIGKHQRRVPGFDEKILALYAKGMTTRDIQDLVRELYGVDISAALVSEITADLDAEAIAWRTRPLAAVWPIVYFDGIVVHVRGANGHVAKHTVYVALGVNLEGHKELLGLWLSENEGAKFWLACLTDLKNRGLHDIFVACIDGLSGFSDAIHVAYPQTTVQLCIVHLVRAALCQHRGQPRRGRRPEEDLRRGDGRRGRTGAGEFRSSVGRQVSDDLQAVAGEMDRHHHAVRLPAGDSPRDLHDQRDRVREQRDSQVHAEPQALSQRGLGLKDRLHGHPRGVPQMDDADPPLETSPQPLRHPIRGPHAPGDQQITHQSRLTQKFGQARSAAD